MDKKNWEIPKVEQLDLTATMNAKEKNCFPDGCKQGKFPLHCPTVNS